MHSSPKQVTHCKLTIYCQLSCGLYVSNFSSDFPCFIQKHIIYLERVHYAFTCHFTLFTVSNFSGTLVIPCDFLVGFIKFTGKCDSFSFHALLVYQWVNELKWRFWKHRYGNEARGWLRTSSHMVFERSEWTIVLLNCVLPVWVIHKHQENYVQ